MLTGFLLLAVSGCAPQVDVEAERAMLHNTVDVEFLSAAQEKDVERLISFYADAGTAFPPDAPIVNGKEAIRAVWSDIFANPGFAIDWQTTKVEISRASDLGYTVSTYELTTIDLKGVQVTESGSVFRAWRRQPDGTWKVATDFWKSGSIGPPKPVGLYPTVDRILETMGIGNIAFNVPRTMVEQQDYEINLLVSPSRSMQELQEELRRHVEDHENLEGARIKLTERMEARLTGPNFEITRRGTAIQAVGEAEPTKWQWDVLPKKAGWQELHLTLSAHLVVNDIVTPRTIDTFEKVIKVQVDWDSWIKRLIYDQWTWAWSIILLLGGYLLGNLRKRTA